MESVNRYQQFSAMHKLEGTVVCNRVEAMLLFIEMFF